MDPNDPKSPENQTAAALLERVSALSVSVKQVAEEVKQIKSAGVEVDTKETIKAYEELRSKVESLQDAVRTSKRGLYFPGVDDAAKKFNFAKLCFGVARGNPKDLAGFEYEVVQEARKAMEKSGQIRAGHTMWDDAAGGIWVPDQVIPDIILPVYSQSAFIALDPATGTTNVSVIDGLVGNPVKLPEFEGGMIAYWIGEEDDYAESKTKSGNITMTPKKLGVMTRMTEELMQFANPQLDAFIRRDMAAAMSKKVDFTVGYGTGTANIPMGVFNSPKVKSFYAQGLTETAPGSPTAGGTELAFDGLMEMQGAIEDKDINLDASFGIVSHPRYFRRLKKAKVDSYSGQVSNQAYLLGAPFISDTLLKSIIGPYFKSTQIPTKKMIGGTTPGTHDKGTDVLMGNLREIIVGRWGGIQLTNDGGTGAGFIRDQTFIKMRTWLDVAIRQGEALRRCPDAKARD
jgi:HK97 family phage major capsid protein